MKRHLGILVIFSVLSLAVYWQVFLGKININGHLLVSFYGIYGENISFKNIGYDQLRLYYPAYSFTVSQFKNLKVPYWNPYSFSGQPHVAELQSAVFYPLNVFAVFLPLDIFWNFMRISPSVLAAFFMFLYLKRLKLVKTASFFGAISWGFGPFILTWGEEQIITPHAVLWLPLALFCVEILTAKKDPKVKTAFFVLPFAVAFSLLAGFIQLTLYMLIFTAFYALLLNWGNLKRVLLVITALVLGFFLAAVQILPSIELYINSPRSAILLKESAYRYLLPIGSVASYLAPDIFGNPATYNFNRGGPALYYEGILFAGVGVIIFALFAAFYLKDRKTRFFAFWVLVSLVMVTDNPLAKLVLNLPIPVFSSSIANRILVLPAFCLAVLAGLGLNAWLTGKSKGLFRVLLFLLFAYGSIFAYFLFTNKILGLIGFEKYMTEASVFVGLRNLALPVFIFLASAVLILLGIQRAKYKQLAAVMIITLAFFHTFYFANKFFSFTEDKYVFPNSEVFAFLQKNQGNYRIWALGDKYLENNFATFYKLNWPEGYKSLFIKSYGEFTVGMQGQSIEKETLRADAVLGAIGVGKDVSINKNKRELLDMLGVKYVVAGSDVALAMEKQNFTKVFESGGVAVFENKTVLPRAFLASNYEGPPNVDGTNKTDRQIKAERRKLIMQKLLSEVFDWRNAVILEDPSPISPQFGGGSAEIISYLPERVVVETKSAEPKLLFLSDNFYSGWRAKVDGVETKIMRANYTFRAVALTPGEHKVVFYYNGNVFKLGLAVSVLGLGVLGFLTLRKNRLAG